VASRLPYFYIPKGNLICEEGRGEAVASIGLSGFIVGSRERQKVYLSYYYTYLPITIYILKVVFFSSQISSKAI